MMDKEEYKREVVRMFNSLRDDRLKEDDDCSGVQCCEQCALYGIDCGNSTKAFEMIEAVEKWSKEHPEPKYKVSKMEYDILDMFINDNSGTDYVFNNIEYMSKLLEKGYFKGADGRMNIRYYFSNCEIVDDN